MQNILWGKTICEKQTNNVPTSDVKGENGFVFQQISAGIYAF